MSKTPHARPAYGAPGELTGSGKVKILTLKNRGWGTQHSQKWLCHETFSWLIYVRLFGAGFGDDG